MKALYLAGAIAAAAIMGPNPAAAWVHAHGGTAWRGPAGGMHYSHYGVTAGPNWGHYYGPHWGCCYDAGGVAVGAAVGAAAGLAIGATIASLPAQCTPLPNNYYHCGPTYYRTYYGPNGVVYQVVPAP